MSVQIQRDVYKALSLIKLHSESIKPVSSKDEKLIGLCKSLNLVKSQGNGVQYRPTYDI